ncbi:MAG: lipoprotein, partial [Bdellovibrionia bacterium]
MNKTLIALGSLLVLAGCAATSQSRLTQGARVTLEPGDFRVGTYISRPNGFSTASYWIEGPKGLVFVDTQFLLSAAGEMIDWAEKATGKKVILGIVLHPNPDKFNGVEVFKKRNIPVVTSDQVRTLIPSVHQDRHHWFYERYKPDYPDQAPIPETFGNSTRVLEQAGVPIKVHTLGPGCSEAHVVVEFEKHVFVGDLVSSLN